MLVEEKVNTNISINTHSPQWHLFSREHVEVDLGQFQWWLGDQLKVGILLDKINGMLKQKQPKSIVAIV